MCMRNCIVIMSLLVSTLGLAEDYSPGLGEPMTAKALTQLDYTILPDGDGLPGGEGSVSMGAVVYEKHCISCHGEGGKAGVNTPLAGGRGSLGAENPLKTVGSFWPYATTIFDYVRRAMPLQTPGILSNDEIYAVTAYLLYVNDILDQDARLSAKNLPLVKMPNRDGFVWGYSQKMSTSDSPLPVTGLP